MHICEKHTISLDWFQETVFELYQFHIRSLLDRITKETDRSSANVEASIDAWGVDVAEYAAYPRKLGLDSGMYDALHRLFTAASKAGNGDKDRTGIAEYTTMHSVGEGWFTDSAQHVARYVDSAHVRELPDVEHL